MEKPRIHTAVLNFWIFAFTIVLVWFAFVYYPKVINGYKTGKFPTKPLIAPVAAYTSKFPIENSAYRIVYDDKASTYYAFVNGKNLDTFVVNKNGVELALKNALSLSKLCGQTVVYISTEKVKVPPQFKDTNDC